MEDDTNDASVIATAISEIGIPNEVKIIDSAQEAYDYLLSTTDKPFIIMSDVRMPAMNGLEFRKKIMENEYLRRKSIPFVFYTAMVSQEMINEAYELQVQGFYAKASSYEGVREQMLTIMIYWRHCLHPNREL